MPWSPNGNCEEKQLLIAYETTKRKESDGKSFISKESGKEETLLNADNNKKKNIHLSVSKSVYLFMQTYVKR